MKPSSPQISTTRRMRASLHAARDAVKSIGRNAGHIATRAGGAARQAGRKLLDTTARAQSGAAEAGRQIGERAHHVATAPARAAESAAQSARDAVAAVQRTLRRVLMITIASLAVSGLAALALLSQNTIEIYRLVTGGAGQPVVIRVDAQAQPTPPIPADVIPSWSAPVPTPRPRAAAN